MQISCRPVCSSNSFSPIPTTINLHLQTLFWSSSVNGFRVSSPLQQSLNHRKTKPVSLTSLHCTAVQEVVETSETSLNFVEVGYISSVHGLQGELRVKPNTGLPELRFSKPGKRWLKQQVLGGEKIREVELVKGRGHPSKKSWIIKLKHIDSVDQAKLLIGSTLLVTEEDRPQLMEGQFYTRDLIGMKVFLKETSELVGIVVTVVNTGASDLLRVMLDSSLESKLRMLNSSEMETPGHHVWVPFVEEIVPDVDIVRREMHITPPNGLLELNMQSDERSKKERRKLEWKERNKLRRNLIAAKKKLREMEQQHVFDGFRHGEKEQGRLLANQIVGLNSKLLLEALQSIQVPLKRWDVNELVNACKEKSISTIQMPEEGVFSPSKEKLDETLEIKAKGLHLMSKGKMAIVLVTKESKSCEHSRASDCMPYPFLQNLLCADERFLKMEDRISVPLILMSSAQESEHLRMLFSQNDHFGFDPTKVWFLEEAMLPVVQSVMEEQIKYKILMKSPWEILQSPVGSGGIISLFASHPILDDLNDHGVQYIEVCHPNPRNVGANSLLLGLVSSREADIGIQLSKENADLEETVDVIFSIDLMKELVEQRDKLQFIAVPKASTYVQKVENDWVDFTSASPNSLELHLSIYSSLNVCSLDKACILEVKE